MKRIETKQIKQTDLETTNNVKDWNKTNKTDGLIQNKIYFSVRNVISVVRSCGQREFMSKQRCTVINDEFTTRVIILLTLQWRLLNVISDNVFIQFIWTNYKSAQPLMMNSQQG